VRRSAAERRSVRRPHRSLRELGAHENLTGIAEIAVALAGFSGLFAALRRGGGHDFSEIERSALVRLLVASLGTTILSFSPIPLLHLGLAEPAVWNIGCLLLGTFMTGIILWMAASRPTVRFPKLLWSLLSITLVFAGLQFVSVAGLFALPGFGVFVAGLWWLIAVSAMQFLLQVIASTRVG
jgi:hypothetical protein